MVENITLINLATNESLVLDKVTTPDYILDSVNWGTLNSTLYSYKYLNQIGVSVSGMSIGTRPIEITGWIVSQNEINMDRRKSMLNRFVNPLQMMRLKYKGYIIDFYPESSVRYATAYKENNDVMSKFKIEGIASDPLFYAEDESKTLAATTIPKFHFPLIISKTNNPPGGVVFGVREPSLITNVVNNGSVPVGMKIVFKAKGTLTNPSLIHIASQKFFKINKEMVAGEEIEINSNIGHKKVTGYLNGKELNYFSYRDFDSSWLQLEVGDNLFRYNADSNTNDLDVYIYHKDGFMEVEQCY